ncbi:MAG: hypothetical protein WCF84_11150 [Anaerolineae bacterium]
MINQKRLRHNTEVAYSETYTDAWQKVHEQDYFDHRTEREQTYRELFGPGLPILFIEGERRSGKSSHLNWIVFYFVQRFPEQWRDAFTKYNEVQGISTYEAFAFNLVTKISAALKLAPPLNSLAYGAMTEEELVAEIVGLFRSAAPTACLFLYDEIDATFAQKEMTAESKKRISRLLTLLAQACRSTDQPLPMRFIFSALEMPFDLSLPKDLYAIVKLRPSPPEELDHLIDWIFNGNGLAISESDRQRCHALTGDWPFYLHWICHFADKTEITWSSGWPDRAAQKAIELHWEDHTFEKNYVQNFSEAEKKVLISIIKNESLSLEQLEQWDREELKKKHWKAAERLVERGYLVKSEQTYQFRIGMLFSWFRHWEGKAAEYLKYCRNTI